ncbi:unnamed protein product [Parnassius mnemosyne]|uniref:Craniofacial development protein 2-like n=1 Tax=Parnassius mnemosyne TaxID=213953 RepID=A0AAV1KGC6_9NEOP
MKKGNIKKVNIARAYPRSDVSESNVKYADNEEYVRTFPVSDEYDKNYNSHILIQSKIRLATWNLGTLTEKGQELAKVLQARKINILCCLQETKWKGSKSRDLGLGYQFLYCGNTSMRNGYL